MKPFVRISQWAAATPALVKDTALALVLTVPLLIDLARQELPPDGPFRSADPLGYLLVAMLILPLALRRRYPAVVFGIILVDALVVTALLYAPSSFGFGLIVATYTVAASTSRPGSLVALWLAQAFTVVIKLRVIATGLDVDWFDWPLDFVYIGGAWYLGDTIRTKRRYADQLERNREELARHAVVEERTSMARELHDIVGHAMSVIVIHAAGGEQQLDSNPGRARRAFQAIAQVGRETLSEMDRLLGALRSDELDGNWLVRPSLTSLSHLVDELRALGLEVTTTVEGIPVPLSASVDQAAFRIIQEALTNTVKHAGPTTAEVTVHYLDDELEVQIRDHGRGVTPTSLNQPDHLARGLSGMRERVDVHDGQLVVGPGQDGGFIVTARLPLPKTATA